MNDSARNQLRLLQRSLYDQAFAEASSIVGEQSRNLIKYSAQFERSLPEEFQHSSLTELLENLRKKDFVIFGDFHSLRQSQRGFLRLLRSYRERLRDPKLVIALELFKAKDQPIIDEFMASELSESEFLRAINYVEDWGFPWQNFKMILEFARQQKIKVVGINTENGGRDGLTKRDKFAANIMLKTALRHPDHKIFCLIGEHHLADNHLPSKLWNALAQERFPGSILRIVSNVDRYYFQLPAHKKIVPTDYIKLKKDFYCIMNTPPWMKWQSFSIWEEMRHSDSFANLGEADEHDDDLNLHTEESFDVDYQFLRFCQSIAKFLQLRTNSQELENFNIFYSRDADFYSDLSDIDDAGRIERMIGRVSIDGVYFQGDDQSILLTHISINNLAEAAGQYVHSLATDFLDHADNPTEAFYRRVIKYSVGMLTSRILNPRRQCSDIASCKQYLLRHKRRQLHGRAKVKRQSAQNVLGHHDWIQRKLELISADSPKQLPAGIINADLHTDYEVSRFIGHWLGHVLNSLIIRNRMQPKDIIELLFQPMPSEREVWEVVSKMYRIALR